MLKIIEQIVKNKAKKNTNLEKRSKQKKVYKNIPEDREENLWKHSLCPLGKNRKH